MDDVIRADISQGIEPVPIFTDQVRGMYLTTVDGIAYEWPINKCPFTLTKDHCADKALILKHGNSA